MRPRLLRRISRNCVICKLISRYTEPVLGKCNRSAALEAKASTTSAPLLGHQRYTVALPTFASAGNGLDSKSRKTGAAQQFQRAVKNRLARLFAARAPGEALAATGAVAGTAGFIPAC